MRMIVFEGDGSAHGDTISPVLDSFSKLIFFPQEVILINLLETRSLEGIFVPMIVLRILNTFLIDLVDFIIPFFLVNLILLGLLTTFIQIILT